MGVLRGQGEGDRTIAKRRHAKYSGMERGMKERMRSRPNREPDLSDNVRHSPLNDGHWADLEIAAPGLDRGIWYRVLGIIENCIYA